MVLWRQRRTLFIHVRVWFHCVVTRKLHSIFPKYLTVRKLHIVIVIAPFRKTTCIGLEKIEHVSIFDLQIEEIKLKNAGQKRWSVRRETKTMYWFLP